MTGPRGIVVSPRLAIPLDEIEFRATRAGGPGGQHVNRSATRVELWWNLAGSPSLTEEDRTWLRTRLRPRLTAEGMLRLVSDASRSQTRNKAAALERFRALLAQALVRPRPRRRTRPPRSAHERRLAGKRARSERKRERRKPRPEE
ncbi:MAG TPA: alternative ribosome rescue aminoacyl-tRNA hydrolase ArfB [Gemmatimonadales bacterium]|jgi:ribosome-associated protein|nr:alternative ribosome rescue aminoacyl-tRNA hydrolase ArfB [Gemmatimonadales bacterium]